jgi:hypothetical protein
MSLHVITAAAESGGEAAVNPYVVGVISLAILLALIVALLMFGAGREHS